MTVPSDRKEAFGLDQIRERAERTQALAPMDRAPVGEWPAMVLEVLAVVERYENALRAVTKANWNPNAPETPFQYEQRVHRIAAAALAGTE